LDISSLENMIAKGQDSAMLRLTLARLLVRAEQLNEAATHLKSAVKQDPDYSAAWRELGAVLRTLGQNDAALAAWRTGIEIARSKGDKQSEKEMGVYVRRLLKLKTED